MINIFYAYTFFADPEVFRAFGAAPTAFVAVFVVVFLGAPAFFGFSTETGSARETTIFSASHQCSMSQPWIQPFFSHNS